MTEKNSSLITSTISTRSRVALAALFTVTVVGTVCYRSRYNQNDSKQHPEDKEDEQEQEEEHSLTKDELLAAVDDNSLYNDFVSSLPDTLTLDKSTDSFLSNLFSGDYIPSIIPISFEELKNKMAALYPNFESQLETIKNMYNTFWEWLSLEDFKKIAKESLEEDDDPVLHPEIRQDAYVREGQDLSEEEIRFAKTRKEKVRAAFAFFIGVDEHEVEIEDIPNIGIASSGGGYRAMVSCSGYLHAMGETGILDCVMYMAGVSGSTWAMSQFYSPLTDASVATLKDHLSSRIHTHIANLSNFLIVLNASRHNSKIILSGIIQRYYQQNGTISLVDIFGMLLGSVLLSRKVTITAATPENEKQDGDDDHHVNEDMDHWYSESIGEPSPLTQQKNDQSAAKIGTIQEDDGAEVKPRILRKNEIKLSKQRKYFEDGSLPMPIYCAVRHDIEQAGVTKAATMSQNEEEEEKKDTEIEAKEGEPVEDKAENKTKDVVEFKSNDDEGATSEEGNKKEDKIEQKVADEPNDLYQWFEFTPYDMGSEEINAWIPIWAFGRKFEQGKNTEKLPEQSIGILMGMFGSAFAASLAHFYQEIRILLPSSAVEKADEMMNSYQSSVSTIHPISPASFPNPFYKMHTKVQTKNTDQDKEEILRSDSLVESEQIGLMDAGMDNNLPYYPLLRKGRDVDIIISLDLSADIQDMPYFDRAEGYAKRRGIAGWPVGAGWPKKDQDEEQEQKQEQESLPVVQESKKKSTAEDKKKEKSLKSKYPLDTCTVFESTSSETTPANNANTDDTASIKTTYPENTNPITLVYFPLIVNDNYDPDFDPQHAEFCSTWNFVYTSEQVEKLHGLAEANVKDNLEKVRKVVKETWKRKRNERLKRENLL